MEAIKGPGLRKFDAAMIIDADNAIAGRLASSVAKMILKGDNVLVVNAEKAVISGNPAWVLNDYLTKVHRGDSYHGPFYPKQPERILRRMVWGMLPKKGKGRDALHRLRVICGAPEGVVSVRVPAAENKLEKNVTTLGAISARVGGRAS